MPITAKNSTKLRPSLSIEALSGKSESSTKYPTANRRDATRYPITMSAASTSTISMPAFHSDDPEQSGDYRTFSALALISLVFGIVSPLALAGPFLLAIPLFGIGVALLALRRIAVSGGVLTGNSAAMIGLVLCVASLFAPFSRDLAFRAMRVSKAEEFGTNWIALVKARQLERAFHLTLEGARPPAKPQPAGQPGPGSPPQPQKDPYQEFLDRPVIKALAAAGENAEIHPGAILQYDPQNYRRITIRQQYSVSPASPAASAVINPLEVVVSIQRGQMPGEAMSRWIITGCDDAKTPADSK
jgi:hypothetical protein